MAGNTYEIINGRSDFQNDSFVQYLNTVAPALVGDTSDISQSQSRVARSKSPVIHGNIAEELNNYDVVPLQGRPGSNLGVRRATSSCSNHQKSLNQSGALLEAANSQLTARFSQF